MKLVLNRYSSPSMDEAQTKEELRPVKKQLVGGYTLLCLF